MENESLDLREPGVQCWKHLLSAVRKKLPIEETVRQVELKLPKAIRKAFAEFGECGVDLFQSNDYLKSPRSLEHLKAFLIHYSELGRWKSDESIPAYILNHLRGTKILKSDEPTDNVAKLYRNYRNEWSRLIESRRRLGVPWTGLIDEEHDQMQGVRHVSA